MCVYKFNITNNNKKIYIKIVFGYKIFNKAIMTSIIF
jgi:hypothetical protein